MRIEITDREHWLQLARKELERISARRKKEDAVYEANWRKRWLLPDRKPTEFPSPDWPWYPSCTGWGTEYKLKRIITVLESEGTGAITFTEEDIAAIL